MRQAGFAIGKKVSIVINQDEIILTPQQAGVSRSVDK
ncbi:hypothetical protein [Thalassomonas actiniarum]|uniref:Uncharacterized protein n=1 Tax=Thalassomonas actiniarum TaxID=485447 RepID=A0AAE9YVP8_9GAMM|nr:hypothetical protein SG35_001845 [Thalassomonas actiniarum]